MLLGRDLLLSMCIGANPWAFGLVRVHEGRGWCAWMVRRFVRGADCGMLGRGGWHVVLAGAETYGLGFGDSGPAFGGRYWCVEGADTVRRGCGYCA